MTRTVVPRDDDEKIVDCVEPLWREAEKMRAVRYSQDKLIASLEAYIRRGVDETQLVIEEAKTNDFYDFVLRRLFRNMIDAGEMPHSTLRAYGLTPPRKRKPGPRSGYEKFVRNVGLTFFILWVCEVFNMNPTRDQSTLLGVSGCSVMQKVLSRCGDQKAETTIQNIYLSVAGEVAGMTWVGEGGWREHIRADIARRT